MSGRHVMMGYMGSEERTAETLEDSEEGWLRYERNQTFFSLCHFRSFYYDNIPHYMRIINIIS